MAKFNLALLVPPVIFAGLAGMFYIGLSEDNPADVPSLLTGKHVPALNLTDLRGDPAPTIEDLELNGIKLVNFWASWCGPCRTEHPNLMKMAENGIPIIGVNYKDNPGNALGFLASLGDPFAKVGADFTGRNAIEWGVTGVPETFVIDGNGEIVLRYPGPITGEVFTKYIAPAIQEAIEATAAETAGPAE